MEQKSKKTTIVVVGPRSGKTDAYIKALAVAGAGKVCVVNSADNLPQFGVDFGYSDEAAKIPFNSLDPEILKLNACIGPTEVKTGREHRRERRKNQRKNK